MEGYYVDNAVAWNSKQSIDFVNEALGIRKPLVRGLRLMDYPGWRAAAGKSRSSATGISAAAACAATSRPTTSWAGAKS